MIEPRIRWVPPRSRSLGAECAAFWRAAGGHLFLWQEFAIDGMLGLAANELWASTDDGLCVARQNGKGVIEQAIEVFFAFELGYPVVMHTAHEFATSQEHQMRLAAFIQECPHLHSKVKPKGGYMFANGRESINLRSGCRIIFKARTKGGGRGYSGDLLVWDEAMVIPEAVAGAQRPMLRASRARHGPKIIYAGSAVDQQLHDYGIPFSLIRERGLKNAANVSYQEWSASYEHPSEMTDEILRDRSWWPLANPSIPEGLIAEEYMADEIEGLPARTAAVELGCVGDWPDTSPSAGQVIKLERWNELVDPNSQIVGPTAFVYDINPERSRSSITAAGLRADGLLHVEVIECRSGTGWVVESLAGYVARNETAGVFCDDLSPAASLVAQLERKGITVETLDSGEHAEACGLFYDVVEQGTIRHLGQDELAQALKGAKKRTLVDRWAWAREKSTVDITPLVGVTIGAWAMLTKEATVPMVAFV